MILLIISALLIFLLLLNIYNWHKSIRSLEKELRNKEWFNASKEEFVKHCYNFVADHFGHIKHCYYKRPWRNFFYCNIWNLKGEGLPCHMVNFLFQRSLLNRLPSKKVRTVITSKPTEMTLIHFFSKVKIKGKWIPIDAWGKKRGVPYGKIVYEG